jgi:hypothetical protein
MRGSFTSRMQVTHSLMVPGFNCALCVCVSAAAVYDACLHGESVYAEPEVGRPRPCTLKCCILASIFAYKWANLFVPRYVKEVSNASTGSLDSLQEVYMSFTNFGGGRGGGTDMMDGAKWVGTRLALDIRHMAVFFLGVCYRTLYARPTRVVIPGPIGST